VDSSNHFYKSFLVVACVAFWGNEFYSLITFCEEEVLCLLLIYSLVTSFDVSCSSCKKQWIIPYSTFSG